LPAVTYKALRNKVVVVLLLLNRMSAPPASPGTSMVVSSSSSSSPKVDYMHVAKMAAASHRAAVEAGAHAYLSQARVGGGMVPTSPVIVGIDAATGQPKFYSPNFQGAYGPGRGKLAASHRVYMLQVQRRGVRVSWQTTYCPVTSWKGNSSRVRHCCFKEG
jgi:hypothetical protein